MAKLLSVLVSQLSGVGLSPAPNSLMLPYGNRDKLHPDGPLG